MFCQEEISFCRSNTDIINNQCLVTVWMSAVNWQLNGFIRENHLGSYTNCDSRRKKKKKLHLGSRCQRTGEAWKSLKMLLESFLHSGRKVKTKSTVTLSQHVSDLVFLRDTTAAERAGVMNSDWWLLFSWSVCETHPGVMMGWQTVGRPGWVLSAALTVDVCVVSGWLEGGGRV